MSINSLANFGTPGLDGSRSAVYQPVLTYRYRVIAYGIGASPGPAPYAFTRQVESVDLPQVTFPVINLDSYVSRARIAGRGQWSGEMSIVFKDEISNAIRELLEGQVSKQKNFYDQTESRAGENYMFEMDVQFLAGGATAGSSNSDPNVLRTYSYSGCFISALNDGQMTYDSDDGVKKIETTIAYNNVVMFNENGTRMGAFSHTPEITGRIGVLSVGLGAASGSGVSVLGASVSVSNGNVTVGGSAVV